MILCAAIGHKVPDVLFRGLNFAGVAAGLRWLGRLRRAVFPGELARLATEGAEEDRGDVIAIIHFDEIQELTRSACFYSAFEGHVRPFECLIANFRRATSQPGLTLLLILGGRAQVLYPVLGSGEDFRTVPLWHWDSRAARQRLREKVLLQLAAPNESVVQDLERFAEEHDCASLLQRARDACSWRSAVDQEVNIAIRVLLSAGGPPRVFADAFAALDPEIFRAGADRRWLASIYGWMKMKARDGLCDAVGLAHKAALDALQAPTEELRQAVERILPPPRGDCGLDASDLVAAILPRALLGQAVGRDWAIPGLFWTRASCFPLSTATSHLPVSPIDPSILTTDFAESSSP